MSCMDLYLIEKVYPAKYFSIHCVNTSWLKLNFEREFQSNVFDNVSNKLVSAHDIECFDCDRWKSQMYLCIDVYFQSCQLMFRVLTWAEHNGQPTQSLRDWHFLPLGYDSPLGGPSVASPAVPEFCSGLLWQWLRFPLTRWAYWLILEPWFWMRLVRSFVSPPCLGVQWPG